MSLGRREPLREESFGHSMVPLTTGDGGKDTMMMVFDWSPTVEDRSTESFLRTLALLDNEEKTSRASLAEPGGISDALARSLAHRVAVLC